MTPPSTPPPSPTWNPPPGFVCDGCTFAPDTAPNGADLLPACRNHDYRYSVGGPESERLRVDQSFFLELVALGAPRWLAAAYFFRVRFWGIAFWNYRVPAAGGLWLLHPPPSPLQQLSLLVRRYFQLPQVPK